MKVDNRVMENFDQTNWWRYLEEPMQDLAKESIGLLEREERDQNQLHDYSFVVFPMAKAYEGFLKKMFLDMGLINRLQYQGEYFRIGKSLNPNLPKRYRSGWVWGKMVSRCGGEEIPFMLWQTWKRARNRIFHFFPNHREFITLAEARELVEEIEQVMGKSLAGCSFG